MKKQTNTKLLMILAIAIPIVIGVLLLVKNVAYSENKDNTTTGINKEQIVEELKISDGLVIQEKGLYTYTANVTNTKEEAYNINYLTFTFYDKENNKIATLYGYVGRELAGKESVPILASVDKDITGATKVEIELKK